MNTPSTAPFDTEAAFRQAIDTITVAAHREIRIFDRDLTCVAIERKSVAEALEQYLSGDRNRRLRIVIHDQEFCARYCPRISSLVRRFSQSIEIRQSPEELRHLQESYILADVAHAAIRFSFGQPRGKIILDDSESLLPWWKRFDDLWLLSTPCLSPTRLGL